MKTVGIVGGIGPESTIEYYRFLIAGYRARTGDLHYPRILIDSIDLTKMLGLVAAQEIEALVDDLAGEVRRLVRAGADFVVLASNTPHLVFDELRDRSPVPMISIVEAAAEAAQARGLTKVGLLGTRSTMQGRFYPEVFAKRGLVVVAPREADQAYVHEKYMGELVPGVLLPETRDGLLAVVRRLRERDAVEGVVLGGTELPLILRDAPDPGVPFLDTTRIHVERILDEMLA